MKVRRLANGRLLGPLRAVPGGTLRDGMQEIGPDHPDYAKWLAQAPKFIDIAMPERFVLEVPTYEGGWIDHGLFRAADFDRLDDGAYLCAGHGGSPLYLRCLEQRGHELDVLDGQDDAYTYRLVAYPSERYRALDS